MCFGQVAGAAIIENAPSYCCCCCCVHVKLPRQRNDRASNPNFAMDTEPQNADARARNQYRYLQRLRMMKSVDEMLDSLREWAGVLSLGCEIE